MTRVKICGIQEPEHAIVAAEAGADYIGLNFVPGSRRQIDSDKAREIISALMSYGGRIRQVVGLFADQIPGQDMAMLVDVNGLDAVQLCGNESLEDCDRFSSKGKVKVIKVIHVPDNGGKKVEELSGEIERFASAGHMVILDRKVEGLQGGTGQTFDWAIAAQLSRQGYQFLLAGGLTPDNVAEAIARVHPWGVDVSSGVETDGVKDPDKIRAFIKNVREADG